MALLHIGNAVSFGSPEDWRISPDDRQERLEIIGGNVVQDFGVIHSGDTITVSATFKEEEFQKLVTIWENRTLVTVTDEAGNAWSGMRIRIVSDSYVKMFPDTHQVEIEIWRV